MGCGSTRSTRNKSYLLTLKEKIVGSYQRTTSNLTISSSSISTTKPSRCMKFKIITKDLKFCRSDFELNWSGLGKLALAYTKDYNFIKESYNSFIFIKRYLFTLCHEACIPNFNMKDSVLILMISIMANQTSEMSLIETFPYFFIKGELNSDTIELLKAWRDYVQAIEKIVDTHQGRLEKSAKNLEEFLSLIEKNKEKTVKIENIFMRIKNIQEAISTSAMMIQEAKDTQKEIRNFVKKLENKEILGLRKLGNKASQAKVFRSDLIVHQILSDN